MRTSIYTYICTWLCIAHSESSSRFFFPILQLFVLNLSALFVCWPQLAFVPVARAGVLHGALLGWRAVVKRLIFTCVYILCSSYLYSLLGF